MGFCWQRKEDTLNILKKGCFLFVLVCVAIVLSSCATLFNEKTPAVSFMSSPSAAQVYVNGAQMGETPCTIKLETNKEYTIEFRKEGYPTKTYFLTNEIGPVWIILDILGGLIPIIVDAATGDWHELSQEYVSVSPE
jgi:hypothetical protein